MTKKLPLRKKIALELFRKYKKNEAKIHNLNYLFWEATLRCNLNCLHCGSDCHKEVGVPDMPKEDFINAIDKIKDHVTPEETMIVITGGEALVRKDIEEIGLELYNRKFPWGIVTNGYLLSERRLRSLMEAGMRSITISLDGMRDSHNWLRNSDKSYDKVYNAVTLLPQTQNLTYDAVTCITKKNIDELEEIREMLIEKKFASWRIFTIYPIGRAKENPDLNLTPQEFKKVFDFIRETRKQGLIKTNYGCEGFFGKWEGEFRDNFFYCRAGINVGSILVDGSISACPNLRENFIQGNIYKDDFIETWNNKYQDYRDRSWTKRGICGDCELHKYCEGNGLHLWDSTKGEVQYCHLQRLEEAEELMASEK